MRLVVPLLLLALLAGCGGGSAASDEDRAAAVATTEAPPAATEPSGLDPIAGESLDGRPIRLDDFRGRYLFVNVWSSW